MSSYFAIIDYEDGYKIDIPIKGIEMPRKNPEDYIVGERVQARYPRFSGVHPGIVAAVSANREWLKTMVYGPRPVPKEPKSVLLGKENEVNVAQPKQRMEVLEKDIDELNKTCPVPIKKRKTLNEKNETATTTKESDEAKKARLEDNKIKRDQEKERQKQNLRASAEMISATATPSVTPEKFEELLTAVMALTEKVDNLSKPMGCYRCLKDRYKVQKKDVAPPQLPPLSLRSPLSVVASPSPLMSPTRLPSTSPLASPTFLHSPSPTPLPSPLPSPLASPLPFASSSSLSLPSPLPSPFASPLTEELETARPKCAPYDSELVHFGESRYGVFCKSSDLLRAQSTSKSAVKFSLSSLEFLLTPEECKDNLTVYGEGKGKKAMVENKRKALRSQIFSLYHQDCSELEKQKIWETELVPKINNKIRGIRNNKYVLP